MRETGKLIQKEKNLKEDIIDEIISVLAKHEVTVHSSERLLDLAKDKIKKTAIIRYQYLKNNQ